MCQCDTYDPCPGPLYVKKNIIRKDPGYVRDKLTRVMFQFLLYVCTLYFTLANLGLYMYQQMKAVENLLV